MRYFSPTQLKSHISFEAAHTIIAHLREYPPGVDHGSYFDKMQWSQNTHGENKRAWFVTEAYQKRSD